MAYKEFNLDLNPQDNNILESKGDEDAMYITSISTNHNKKPELARS